MSGAESRKRAIENVKKMSKRDGDFICLKVVEVLEKIQYHGNL